MFKRIVVGAASLSIASQAHRAESRLRRGYGGQAGPARRAGKPAKKPYVVPKTPWGDPDLQGNYTNKYEQGTPFERPAEFEGKRVEDIQGKELADVIERRQQQAIERDRFLSGDPTGTIAGPMEFRDIFEVRKASRPWFVTEPTDGKIPPMTPEGQRRIAARPRTGSSFSNGVYDSYENLSLYDRCITRGYPSSMLPAIYGDSYQIVQGQGFVGHSHRDDSRDARHPARQPGARQQGHRARHGRPSRPLGRQHARGRDDEFQGSQHLSQRQSGEDAPRRAVHARLAPDDRVGGHGRRSDDLDTAVDVCHAADDERRGAALRVRVPRGQLRDQEHPERFPRRGRGRRDGEIGGRPGEDR